MRNLLYLLPIFMFACPSPDWRTAHTHCPCVDGWQCVGGWCVAEDALSPGTDKGQTGKTDLTCTPKTCADLGLECGTGDNGCEGQVDCGSCGAHQACDSGKCVDQPWCGDGKCNPSAGEDCGTCPTDCGCEQGKACQEGKCVTSTTCGDGTCDADSGENCGTCPADCKCANGQACYSDACCMPKTCTGLGWECGTGDDSCGKTVDCGKCPTHQACQSGKCVDQPYCGNGTCDPNEDCATCAADCACKAGQVCYNNACCTPKTCAELGMDCGTGNDGCGGSVDCGKCPTHQACQSGKCVTLPWCGDGTCDIDENCGTCATDCKCRAGQVCYSNACCTPKTCTDLGWQCGTGDDGCGGTMDCGSCDSGKVCVNHKCQVSQNADLQWITIPGGTFQMGSNNGDDDEKPVHQVTLQTFQMSKTEVTVAQYRACVQAGACTKPDTGGYCNWGQSGRDNHPINCVDWNQAVAFAKWAGGRLPTEAEWEYAARSGGKAWKYPWGNEDATCEYAVISDASRNGCGKNHTWPVCSKSKGNTVQGLCDMAGNVWEWVEDWYHNSYNGAPTDGSAWETPAGSYRILRGGSWRNSFASYCQSALRYYYSPGLRFSALGFRLCRSL